MKTNQQILRDALQTAEMAMLGYTVRNDVISKALKDARAALAATAPESAPAGAPGLIYQLAVPSAVYGMLRWYDTSKNGYIGSREELRRIVYTHPAPSQSPPAATRSVVVGGLRMIPDSECVQSKCACQTTGCWGECSMRRNPVMYGQPTNGITISVGDPMIPSSQSADQVRDAEALRVALRSINAVAIERGDKFGACDQIDNYGQPYQSAWFADLLATSSAAKGEAA